MLTFSKLVSGKGFPREMLGFRYNGRTLADVELKHDSPLRLSKRSNELLILALALSLCGERHASIDDRVGGIEGASEAPDFTVTLNDDRLVGVEVAQITNKNAAAAENLLERLTSAVNNEIRKIKSYDYFDSHAISLQLSIKEQRGYNSQQLLKEVTDLVSVVSAADTPIGAMLFADSVRQPLLKQYRCHGQVTLPSYLPVTVSPDPFANIAASPDADVENLIKQKQRVKYRSVGSELWLTLGVTDPMGQISYNVERFRGKAYGIVPFERLIITDSRRAVFNS